MSKHLRLGKLLRMFGFMLAFMAVSGSVGYAQLSSYYLTGSSPTVSMGVVNNSAHTVAMTVPAGQLASLGVKHTVFSFSGLGHHTSGRLFWTGSEYLGTASNLVAHASDWLMTSGRDYRGTTDDPAHKLDYSIAADQDLAAPGTQIWVTLMTTRFHHWWDWFEHHDDHHWWWWGDDDDEHHHTTITNYKITINEVVITGSNDAEIITYGLPGSVPVVTPMPASVGDGVDQIANTVTLWVPFGHLCDLGTMLETNFTVSDGATLYWTNTEYLSGTGDDLFNNHPEWLMESGTDHSPGANFDYSCAHDVTPGNIADGNSVWLTVLAQNHYFENYKVTIKESPASPDKELTDLDGNTDAASIITGFFDCYGDTLAPTVSAPVPNNLGGSDYTIQLVKGPDYGRELTFTFDISDLATSDPTSPATHTFADDLSGVANAFVIRVTAQNGTTADYRFIPNWINPSTNKELTSFGLLIPKNYVAPDTDPYFLAVGEITDTRTYTVHVPYGTNAATANLAALFTLNDEFAIMTHSEDDKLRQVSGTTEDITGATLNNYKDPVAFTIYDQGCLTVEYFVIVIEDENAGNDFQYGHVHYNILETCGNGGKEVDADFSLGGESGSSSYPTLTTHLPYGSDLDNLTYHWTFSPGATVQPDPLTSWPFTGVPASPLNLITVTAADGVAQQIYEVVMIIGDPSTDAKLLTFDFLALDNSAYLTDDVIGVVNESTHRIDLLVPWGTDVTALKAAFTNSPYSCVFINGPAQTDHTRQTSGDTENDFTLPLTYTVVAQDDETEGYYNVVVRFVPADTQNSLTGLAITGQLDCLGNSMDAEVTGTSPYVVRMRNGRDDATDISVHFHIPELATCDHATDFTIPAKWTEDVVITVTSQSGVPATYTLHPNWVTPSDKKKIDYFAFEPYDDPTGNAQLHVIHEGDIDQDAKTILVHVPYLTDVTALKAAFTLDDKYARLTHSEENFDERVPQTSGLSPINYTTPAAFTVYDEACHTVEYFVTVIVDPNGGNDISNLTFVGKEYQNCESCEPFTVANGSVSQVGNDFTITVPFGTDITAFTLTGNIPAGAHSSPALPITSAPDVNTWYSITVTAADGVATKIYRWKIVRAGALTGTQLLSFGFEDHNNGLAADVWTPVPINHSTFRVDVELPYGKSLASLISTFTHSPMACVYVNGPGLTDKTLLCSGTGPAWDFSHGSVTYTVKAQNGNEAYYNIYVKNTAPATDTWLHNFVVTGLPRCFANLTYDLSETPSALGVVTRSGNNIIVSVKAGTDLTNLNVGFAIPSTATVSPNPAVTHDFHLPVTFTVTAQDGVTTTPYVVTVNRRDPNGAKQITAYTIPTATSSTIDENAKKIDVWVPWATNITNLIATFTLSAGAEMTHSEDTQVLQVSGSTGNNFETPVAYTVWAENCTTVEYFVTVHITPDTNTGISQFTFGLSGCGCDEPGAKMGTTIDSYARRIFVKLPNRDANGAPISLSSLAPSVIGIAQGASISPLASAPQNWNNGPVKYTVKAPDGATTADWYVSVVNPPCKETDILTWKFVDGPNSSTQATFQVGSAVVDATAHTINLTVKPDTDLKALYASTTLSCGASICCNAGGCAGTAIDFSENMCHTCVVKAQDQTVTQDWTICLKYQDIVIPVVTTWSVMAMNCSDSIAVQSNEAGRVFLVHESKVVNNVASYNLADWTGTGATSVTRMVNDRMGNWAAIAAANDTVYVMTNGLYSGIYYAFSVDNSGNISCISAQRVYLDMCDVEVATLCDLRAQPVVYRYKLTGEVFVTYEETRTGGNLKFVQDASCGIRIIDKLNGLDATYASGAGLKNLRGTLDNSGTDLVFIPDCCYKPTVSSTGNVVAPIEQTWDQFVANCYGSASAKMYESMLVKITTPMIAFDDYHGDLNWKYDNLDLATTNAMGGYEWFIQSIFNSSLIGTAIPTVPAYYTGIRTNVNWSGSIYGLITPRKSADISLLTGAVISANPNPALIGGVVVGMCGTVNIKIYNEGVGTSTITALYLDDAAATDGFNLLSPPAVPFTLGSWSNRSVTVNFCPTTAGNKTTYLIVEYGVGKVLRVPINGTTMLIYPLPFSENFNATAQPAAWSPNNLIFGAGGYNLVNPGTNGYYYGWSWVTPNSARPIWLITPGIDMRGATHPVLTFWYGTYFSSYFRVDVSTDYTNWTTVKDWGWHTLGNGVNSTYTVDLAAYAGQIIYIRFYSAQANYFGIDDVVVQEQVTTPIPVANPLVANLGGVQVGQTGTLHLTFKNKGVSILKVKKVEIVAPSQFSLTDTNTYPVEVTNNGFYAYSINGKESVEFDVAFSPTDIGVLTGKIVITYGLYSDLTYEIPMTGEGLSCYTAAVAVKGENYAPSQNTWFKYTADKFSIVQVTSCNPHQDLVTNEYAWDTFLYVYSDCAGTLIASNDDMEAACVYNRASSSVQTAVNAGETIYIFWPLSFPGALYAYDGFYFNINVTYPVDGDVCENAIPLTLPVVDHFGTTRGFNDDYEVSPCSPFSNYMDGNDKVYTITLPYEGYLYGNILGAYGSIHVLDVCPTEVLEKFHCKLFTGGPNGGAIEKKISAGTYFVIISTWSPPQTVDYLLNMRFRGTGIDNAGNTPSFEVYPNPTNGQFRVDYNNTEIADMIMELVNISGQVVYRNEVKANSVINQDIDVTLFAKGVYYLKVNNGKDVKVKKVVVE